MMVLGGRKGLVGKEAISSICYVLIKMNHPQVRSENEEQGFTAAQRQKHGLNGYIGIVVGYGSNRVMYSKGHAPAGSLTDGWLFSQIT